MDPKDLIIEFVNTVFLILLVTFVIFYFIVGKRYAVAAEMVKMAMPLVLFVIVLLFKTKEHRYKARRLRSDNTEDEVVFYPSNKTITIDRFVIIFIIIFIILVPIIDGRIFFEDFCQSIIIGLLLFAWHRHLFITSKAGIENIGITRKQKGQDEVIIFLIPVIVLGIALINRDIDYTDLAQALIPFALYFLWRQYMFRQGE